MTYAERIRRKLTDNLQPTSLEIIDDSHRHAGHLQHEGGAGHEGETHFTVKIVSAAFIGLSRVARQRVVYNLLSEELAERVHALSLAASTPQETNQKD